MPKDKKTLIVDIDGVIADKSVKGDYANAPPLPYGIAQVNKLYDMGYEITLFTARYGDREKGNLHRQYQRGYLELIEWLEKHGVKFHNAYIGKPAGVLYIDDKAARVRADDAIGWQEVWKEVEDLNSYDKYGNRTNG